MKHSHPIFRFYQNIMFTNDRIIENQFSSVIARHVIGTRIFMFIFIYFKSSFRIPALLDKNTVRITFAHIVFEYHCIGHAKGDRSTGKSDVTIDYFFSTFNEECKADQQCTC
ncbi:hypothetical protein D3C87_1566860 [compost metagenome]